MATFYHHEAKKMLRNYYKFIRDKYVTVIDPDNFKLVLAVKCMLIGLIALIIGHFFYLPQEIFLFLSAILFMLIDPRETPKKILLSMIFAGCATIIGCFLVTITSYSIPLLIITLLVVTFIVLYLGQLNYFYSASALFALLIIVMAAGMPGNFSVAIERMISILLGLVLAIISTFLIFPYHTRRKLKLRLGIALQKLADYFYHGVADSLRGNHLNLRHHRLKSDLLQFYIDNRHLKETILKKRVDDAALLEIADIEEDLLETIFALTNIFNHPMHYFTVVTYFPDMEKFYRTTYNLYSHFSTRIISQHRNPISLADFNNTIDELTGNLQKNLAATMQEQVIYNWPFDLSNFIYILKMLQQKTKKLAEALVLL